MNKATNPPTPDGYRRVSNGYTRTGDFVWSVAKHDWFPARKLELVVKAGVVIRSKEAKCASVNGCG